MTRFRASHLKSKEHIIASLRQHEECERVQVYKTALENNLIIFRLYNDSEDEETVDVAKLIEAMSGCLKQIMNLELEAKTSFKCRFNLTGLFFRPGDDSHFGDDNIKNFYSHYEIMTQSDNLDEVLSHHSQILSREVNDFELEGSGWSVSRWLYLDYETCRYDCFRAGSGYIALPKKFADKKATTNIKNLDGNCFFLCILAHIYKDTLEPHQRNDPRFYYPLMHTLNISGIETPVDKRQIQKFLNQNPTISVTVFAIEDNFNTHSVSSPVFKSREIKPIHVDLLLLTNRKFDKCHYVLINDLSRLVFGQVRSKQQLYFCRDCLTRFKSPEDLEMHQEIGCDGVKIRMNPDGFLKFQKTVSMQRHHFTIYADLEALLVKYHTAAPNPNSNVAFTHPIDKHVACAVGYIIKSDTFSDPHLENLRTFVGENCLKLFLDSLERDINYLYDTYINKYYPIDVRTPEMTAKINAQDSCYLCGKTLEVDVATGKKLFHLDHDHMIPGITWEKLRNKTANSVLTSNFRGVSCPSCNWELFILPPVNAPLRLRRQFHDRYHKQTWSTN